jgi:hypothetical protein
MHTAEIWGHDASENRSQFVTGSVLRSLRVSTRIKNPQETGLRSQIGRTNEEIKVELANRLALLRSGEDSGVSLGDVFQTAS